MDNKELALRIYNDFHANAPEKIIKHFGKISPVSLEHLESQLNSKYYADIWIEELNSIGSGNPQERAKLLADLKAYSDSISIAPLVQEDYLAIYVPEKDETIMAYFGTGDNLMSEDIEAGYNAYLEYYTYKGNVSLEDFYSKEGDWDDGAIDGGEYMYDADNSPEHIRELMPELVAYHYNTETPLDFEIIGSVDEDRPTPTPAYDQNLAEAERVRQLLISKGWAEDIVITPISKDEMQNISTGLASKQEFGYQYFRMKGTNNIYDSKGEVAFFDIPTTNMQTERSTSMDLQKVKDKWLTKFQSLEPYDYFDYKKISAISSSINYGFSREDLMALASLHREGKAQKIIFDLLEDCNFHTENSWLEQGLYDKFGLDPLPEPEKTFDEKTVEEKTQAIIDEDRPEAQPVPEVSEEPEKKTSLQRVQESRQEIAQKIVEQMKSGELTWRKGWDKLSSHNGVTGKDYHGINAIRLMFERIKRDLQDPRFMTFKQAKEQGYNIQKGAKGIQLERWIWEKQVPKLDEQGNPVLDENGKEVKETKKLTTPQVVLFTVFNGQDIVGLPPYQGHEHDKNSVEQKMIDDLKASSRCPINEQQGDRCFYRPSTDEIVLPPLSAFETQKDYLATLLHEMGHSTAHPDALNRPLSAIRFGTPEYAREELRAELSSVFSQVSLGVDLSDADVRNHSAYLQNWSQVVEGMASLVESDYKELFKAINDADRISNYIVKNYEQQVELGVTPEITPEVSNEVSVMSTHEEPEVAKAVMPEVVPEVTPEQTPVDANTPKAECIFDKEGVTAIKEGDNLIVENHSDREVMLRPKDSLGDLLLKPDDKILYDAEYSQAFIELFFSEQAQEGLTILVGDDIPSIEEQLGLTDDTPIPKKVNDPSMDFFNFMTEGLA